MHTLSAPSINQNYASDIFPFLTNAIEVHEKNPKSLELVENIKFELSKLVNSINSARNILKDAVDFDRN